MPASLRPSEDVMERMWDRYEIMKKNGAFQPGVLNDFDLNNLPEWMDREKLLAAQATARKYYMSLAFVHLSGLMFVLQLPAGVLPLIATSKSESLAALFLRYLSTINHVNEWSESDLLDPSSKGYKSISHVRQLHKSIYERMNGSKLKNPEDGIWVSQNAMTDTQWAFIGLMFMYPREVCVSGTDEEVIQTLTDISYLWRCVGWMHGITDENNLCSGSVDETVALCHVIFQKRFEPIISANTHCNPIGLQMGLDIVKALSGLIPGMTGEVMLTFWSKVFGIEMPYLRRLSYLEMFLCFAIRIEHTYAHGTRYRAWHTELVRARLARINKNKVKIYQSVRKRDPSLKYAPETVEMTPCGFAIPSNFAQEIRNMKLQCNNNNNNNSNKLNPTSEE